MTSDFWVHPPPCPPVERLAPRKASAGSVVAVIHAADQLDVGTAPDEPPLQVCMAEEGNRAGSVAEGVEGLLGGNQVFILVYGGSMHQVEVVDGQRALRQVADVGGVFGSELSARP